MQTLRVKDFNLPLTLESGQFFRYNNFAGFYYVNSKDRVISLKQNGDYLIYDGVEQDFLKNLFGLNDNYNKIIKEISTDKLMTSLTQKYNGLRLMRQDPWECMISYVCSSASNIPKIQKNIELLSQHFGEKVKVGGYISHSFPKVGNINLLEKIVHSKTGFRANYIYEINKMITLQKINHLQNMEYNDAHNILTQLPGIGPKVADCISLFSLGHTEAFPVDTWIKRIMEKHYFNGEQISNTKIKQFAQDYWGKNAGYAQMFLFMLRN